MIELKEYQQKLEKLQNYLDFAIDVSNASGGQKNTPWKLVRSNQLFIRMTVSCLSFIHLLPKNRYFPSDSDFWDLFSILSIARNFIEAYLMLWYIGVENISEDEAKLRLEILNYHLNNEKYKLYKDFNLDEDILKEFELNIPIAKEAIEKNSLFFSLVKDSNRRKSILKGNEAKYLTNLEIAEKIPFSTEEFKPLYRLFSNHTHSMPFATFSLTDERGSGKLNQIELQYVNIALDFVTKYLLAAIIDTINIFPYCLKHLDKTKLHVIRTEFHIYSKNL